jgi:ribosome biogenesis protein Nip4
MKQIITFSAKFGGELVLNTEFIAEKNGRYFFLSKTLRRFVQEDFYYAGIYLGKAKNGKFFPSFHLLSLIAKSRANKVVIDRKASWLFICGRDIFRKGIVAVQGLRSKNDFTLVMNEHGECLGFGKIVCSLDSAGKDTDIAVRNISDIGDFLRRESW